MPQLKTRSTSLPVALLTAGWLLSPAVGMSESALGVSSNPASAALDFRIIIPPVMQLLENSHPARLDLPTSGAFSAQQKLVVVSNMKRGFCVTMRVDAPQVEAWRLQAPQQGGITLLEVADGYRLCTARPGRYTLLLQHEFDATPGGTQDAMAWPVQTDITAL
jgi:hypothetical protein